MHPTHTSGVGPRLWTWFVSPVVSTQPQTNKTEQPLHDASHRFLPVAACGTGVKLSLEIDICTKSI